MSWFIVALSGYFILALVSVSDKFILSKKLVTPAAFVFYSTAPLIILFLIFPFFNITLLEKQDFLLAVVAGLSLMFGFWTMYRGFLFSEVSHAGPMLGGIMPLFVLFISTTFLGEVLTKQQLWACLFLILGSFLISFEKSAKHKGWHKGLIWIILSGFLFALAHVIAKYLYDIYGFFLGLILTRGFSAIFGLILIVIPSVQVEIYNWFKKIKNTEIEHKNAEKGKICLIIFNKIFGIVGVLLIQFAIALGSVSLVNAMAGVQFGILIIFIGLLSKFYPKILKEEYTKLEVIQEILAILIIAFGLGLLI